MGQGPIKPGLPWKPLQLTEEMIDVVENILVDGNFQAMARMAIGVRPTTWASWIKRGKRELEDVEEGKRDNITLKGVLCLKIEAAEAEACTAMVKDIRYSDNLQVKMKFLECRHSKLFNRSPNSSEGHANTPDDGDVRERLFDALSLFCAENVNPDGTYVGAAEPEDDDE